MGLHPYAAALLLGALALLVMGYLLACERLPRDPDGPSGPGAAAAILAACLLSIPADAPAQPRDGAGLKSLSAPMHGSFCALDLPGAFGGTPRAYRSVLSYRDASRQVGTGWAMTVAAPAGESRPKGDAAGEAGPAPDGAPGAPAASADAFGRGIHAVRGR